MCKLFEIFSVGKVRFTGGLTYAATVFIPNLSQSKARATTSQRRESSSALGKEGKKKRKCIQYKDKFVFRHPVTNLYFIATFNGSYARNTISATLQVISNFLSSDHRIRTQHPDSSGAGYKLLCVARGWSTLYVTAKGSTYKWDTCAAHALLRSLGGGCIDLKYMRH